MLITIVICTYNRADILKITLPCYNALKIPEKVNLEVLVVNNNSNDGTEVFVKDFIERSKSGVNYSYFFEKEQGLSNARNTGYKEASGEYIAYIDDECILPKNWLEIAIQDINSYQPAFLGGAYYGKYLPGSYSTWYKESFGDSYILQYDLPDGPMQQHFLSGGNLIVRRDVFDKIGLFDTKLGMNGETINYGEEQDFQKRLIAQFPKEVILYNSKLFVWHCIRDEKMSISYLFKEALIRGCSSAKSAHNHVLKLFVAPFLLIFFLLKSVVFFIGKLIQGLVFKEHLFTLLHQDYKNGVWRDIGGAMCRSKLLINRFFKRRIRE